MQGIHSPVEPWWSENTSSSPTRYAGADRLDRSVHRMFAGRR
ncbi:hypothetical protein LAUMK35_01944 [Mycobacterium pseudokansasii]|nr:hypothetical protein LAUMK35_01944 [Mycobacterium pseudokansasii]VAZ93375.1 hypothetical protein LAUMK21_01946 [Mycobacterium pseudokansasii]